MKKVWRVLRILLVAVLVISLFSDCVDAAPVGGDPFFDDYENEWYNLAVPYASGVWQVVTVNDSDHPSGSRNMLYHYDNVWGGSRGPMHIANEFTLDDYTTEKLWWIVDQAIEGPVGAGYSHKLQGWNGTAWVDMASLSFNTAGVVHTISSSGGYLEVGDIFAEDSSCEGLARGGGSLTPSGTFEWNDFTNYRIKHQNTIQLDPTTGITWKVATNGLFDSGEIRWTTPVAFTWLPVSPTTYRLTFMHQQALELQGDLLVEGPDGFRYPVLPLFGGMPQIYFNGTLCAYSKIGTTEHAGLDAYTLKVVLPSGLFQSRNRFVIVGKNAVTGKAMSWSTDYVYGFDPDTGEPDPDVPIVVRGPGDPPVREDYPTGWFGDLQFGFRQVGWYLAQPFEWMGSLVALVVELFSTAFASVQDSLTELSGMFLAAWNVLPEPIPELLTLAFGVRLIMWWVRR